MTLIIGLQTKEGVFIAADSASSDGWTCRPVTQSKLFSVRTPAADTVARHLLVGHTHTWRFGQVLRHHLVDALAVKEPDSEDRDPEEYIVGTVVPAIRAVMREHGILKKDSDVESGGQGGVWLSRPGLLPGARLLHLVRG